LSATISGLTNGSLYDVEVRAINAQGNGPYSPTTQGTPATVPAAPAAPTLTVGDASLIAQWTAPADGGSPITGYTVRYKLASATEWTEQAASGLSATISGLTNGSLYDVGVRANNERGNGPYSSATQGTPATTPSAPAAPTLSAGDTTLAVQWAPPDDGGSPITGYTVRWRVDGTSAWTDQAVSASPYTITGLTNDTTYNVQVRAINARGNGPYSQTTDGMPTSGTTVPSAPFPPTLVASDMQLEVSWVPPFDGGSPITGYNVRWRVKDTAQWTNFNVQGSPYIITRLTNGTEYEVQVRAANNQGNGPYSLSTDGTPATVPSAPAPPSLTPSNGTLMATWTEPPDGGSPITGYTVRWKLASAALWMEQAVSGLTYTITGLVNGSLYNVEVRAINDEGNGPYSMSADGTPATTPSAPTAPTLTPGDARLTATWTAPPDGGSPITGYTVRWRLGGTTQWNEEPANASPYTITGLTNDQSYEVGVRAINAQGNGPYSPSSSGTPVPGPTVPSAPTAPTLIPSNAQLTVAWIPPDDGGSPITSYTVRWKLTSAINWTDREAGASPYTITGLVNGSVYEVQVRASNAIGNGPYSESTTGIPVGPTPTPTPTPGPPTPIDEGYPYAIEVTVRNTGDDAIEVAPVPILMSPSGLVQANFLDPLSANVAYSCGGEDYYPIMRQDEQQDSTNWITKLPRTLQSTHSVTCNIFLAGHDRTDLARTQAFVWNGMDQLKAEVGRPSATFNLEIDNLVVDRLPLQRQYIAALSGSWSLNLEPDGRLMATVNQTTQLDSWGTDIPLYPSEPMACRVRNGTIKEGVTCWQGAYLEAQNLVAGDLPFTAPFTIAFWVYPTGTDDGTFLVRSGRPESPSQAQDCNITIGMTDYRARLFNKHYNAGDNTCEAGSNTFFSQDPVFESSEWAHVVLTAEGNNGQTVFNMYVDDELVIGPTTPSNGGGVFTTEQMFEFAAVIAEFDDLAYFSRVLTAEERNILYTAGQYGAHTFRGMILPDREYYWPFNYVDENYVIRSEPVALGVGYDVRLSIVRTAERDRLTFIADPIVNESIELRRGEDLQSVFDATVFGMTGFVGTMSEARLAYNDSDVLHFTFEPPTMARTQVLDGDIYGVVFNLDGGLGEYVIRPNPNIEVTQEYLRLTTRTSLIPGESTDVDVVSSFGDEIIDPFGDSFESTGMFQYFPFSLFAPAVDNTGRMGIPAQLLASMFAVLLSGLMFILTYYFTRIIGISALVTLVLAGMIIFMTPIPNAVILLSMFPTVGIVLLPGMWERRA